MYASEIVKYARSLALVQHSDAINWDDEMQSLNQAYKDVYAKIAFAKAAYDYMTIGPVLLDLTQAEQLGTTEWAIPLPDNVYSLRYVDYNRTGYWMNMPLFNINERNRVGGQPQYRWLGDKLWMIGTMPSQIRIRYFPPPIVPSVPDISYQYALQYPIYQLPGVTSPQYFSLPDPVNEGDNDYCIYVLNGESIIVESYSLNTVTTLYVLAGITQCAYWLGYVYYLQGGDVWRVTTSLTTVGVPVQLTTHGNITTFSVTADNKLAYSTPSSTFFSALDGSDESLQYTYATSDVCLYTPGNYAYIKNDNIYINDTPIGNAIVANLTSDGTYLYYLDQGGFIHRLTLDNPNNYAILGDFGMYSGMTYMGSWWGNRFAIVDNQFNVQAVSTYLDTNFNYPLNDGFEIIAYQSAIDYKRKSHDDYSQLEQRLNEIWTRFELTLKRDSGRPEHRVADIVSKGYQRWYY